MAVQPGGETGHDPPGRIQRHDRGRVQVGRRDLWREFPPNLDRRHPRLLPPTL